MLKDVRVHGSITDNVDFYATLAGEKLLSAPFYEIAEENGNRTVSFFLSGMYFKLDQQGLAFSGTGGAVSEYMFGSNMPLQDLGNKAVRNRLLLFGTYMGEKGLSFTPQVSGTSTYDDLFINGNAVSNSFYIIKTPWPYSVRRTQEVLLKTLGKILKRSENVGKGDDAALREEILRELAEPEATLLLLRLVHRSHQRFYQFVSEFYRREGEWTDKQKSFAVPLAKELGITQYQRERIAVDILYKDVDNQQVVDEYKDVLLELNAGRRDPASALPRLNSLRNLAMRHRLPPTLFDTLDGLIPAAEVTEAEAEPEYLRKTREIFEGLFLSSKPPSEVVGHAEIIQLLSFKQQAQENRDNGFEQILLETGRILDEQAAEGGDLSAFEVFSEVVTYFDRFDNAVAPITQLAFMEHATLQEDKVRSILGNKRALDQIEEGLFKNLVVGSILDNPYLLRMGRLKVLALIEGLADLERGERTLADIVSEIKVLTDREVAEQRLFATIKKRIKSFYFDLSNPMHLRLLKRDTQGELLKRDDWSGPVPEGAFEAALEQVKMESEYVNNVLPRVIESTDEQLKEDFLKRSKMDLYRMEELERKYLERHGLAGERDEPDFRLDEDDSFEKEGDD